jgi:hypothetical protein
VKVSKKQVVKPTGPKTLVGSAAAKRQAALILEALSGVRTPLETSAELGVALARYYVLETRALQGLITGLEERPRGRQKSAQRKEAELHMENVRLRREALRWQALSRLSHKALGVSSPGEKVQERKRAPRQRARVNRVVDVLRAAVPTAESASAEGGA